MDPSVYARHYGVQSEGNKGTVTRVACGEILYRRAVDSYKRDMRYKVNSIRKEQKKLRHCMRGYRRKLRETEKRHREDEDDAMNLHRKVHRVPKELSLEDDSSWPVSTSNNNEDNRPTDSTVHLEYHSQGASKTHASDSSNHTRLPPLDHHATVGIHHSTEGHGLPFPPPQSPRHVDEVEGEVATRPVIENVGRILRRGSGKIGAASHRRLLTEEDNDTYSLLSDSSDEDNDKSDEVIEIVSFKHGRFIRENTPLSLIKMNSAYFKPVEPVTVDEIHQSSNEEPNENEEIDRADALQASVNESEPIHESNASFQNESEPKNLPGDIRRVDVPNEIKNTHANFTPIIILPNESEALNPSESRDKMMASNERSHELKPRKKRKKKSSVSYGDLVKLQHTNNTRKLLSLVDQLTESMESPVTPPQKKRASYAHDPRERAALKRREHVQPTQMVGSSLTTYGSVFYAMKYGYVTDAPESDSERAGLLPSQTVTPGFDLKSTNSFMSHTSFNTAQMSTYPDDTASAPPDNWMSRFSNLELGLNVPDFVGGQNMTLSEPGLKHSNENVGNLLDIVSNANAPTAKRDERVHRRSSILAASNYVSQRRSRGSISQLRMKDSKLDPKHAQRERDLFQRRRLSSVNAETTGGLHQQLADERKESWSSALGRIKMVHTLVDLTHIM